VTQPPLVFGVYPFGVTGGPNGIVQGPPDDVGRIGTALHGLAGNGPPLLLRVYVVFDGSVQAALDQVAQFAQIGAQIDLSLNFHDPDGDVERWCSFVEQVVSLHGSAVGSIGVTNEANLLEVPFAPDGAYPNALEALVDGVLAAAEAKRRAGATAALGFAAASEGDGSFWERLVRRNGEAFGAATEFAGLTMYPGGFSGPAPSASELIQQTTAMLTDYRAQLTAAGIPATVPIRISECGWPTGTGRSEHDQAQVLATILATVLGLRAELNVTHWELFTLRDANTGLDDVFGHFGVLHDDYTPKPAYDVLRALMTAGRRP
jgi:hypothetical protein